ncbi:AMP-binding protein [Baekduia soli]|uniref:AMP-binding protein n=1 Tax=Baekduia soli TaxID=496014 RepID=A0A5B8U8U2_9ACTN|nr:AMP-binding protein [Baekduia soli]QEC49420.1 AMP-binding protein [Baekduia soli]
MATATPAYAHGASPVPLLGDTVGDNLARTAARHPDRLALVSRAQGLRLTYAAFDAEVDRVARALMACGMQAGDRLGIWSPNRAEWAVLQYAAARAGVILVNINPAYRSHELEYVLRQSGCRMLVAAERFKDSDYVAMAQAARPVLEGLEHVVHLGTPSWEELLAGAEATDPEALRARSAGLDAGDPINIQYTSGTTGFPKGAMLSHHNILNNGYFVGEGCRLTERDVICVPVPYYHCFGMVMGNLAATTHGACVVLPGEGFEPGAVLEAVQSERCTALYGVPTMFISELEHPGFDGFDLSSLRTGIMAGSPCPIEVMRKVIDRMGMGEVTIAYGMTETSPVSTQTLAEDDLEHRVATVGRVHPHVEIRVADPDTGRTLARGQTGEFQTRGYSVMLGYWEDPQRTAQAIDAARWMHTGDQAVMDEDGYIRIVGRIKDMIIRGGENVYPREIEEFLHTHPDIADAQVVGVPDERFGEEAMAWVVRREGSGLSEEDVRAFCRGRLAHYKVPRYVRFCIDYPMTVTGKVQKNKLRELAAQGLAEPRTAPEAE